MTESEVGEEGGVIGKAPRARIRTWDAHSGTALYVGVVP